MRRKDTPTKRAFLAAYEKTCNISEAAKAARIRRNSHYRWMRTDPEYQHAFEESQEIAAQCLEDTAVERAKAGSDTLLIFLLKGVRPEKYRERYEVTGKDGGPLIDIGDLRSKIERQLAGIAAESG